MSAWKFEVHRKDDIRTEIIEASSVKEAREQLEDQDGVLFVFFLRREFEVKS